MLSVNVKTRPTITQIMNIPFIEKHARAFKLRRLTNPNRLKHKSNLKSLASQIKHKRFGLSPNPSKNEMKTDINFYSPKKAKPVIFKEKKQNNGFKRSNSYLIQPVQIRRQKKNKSVKKKLKSKVNKKSNRFDTDKSNKQSLFKKNLVREWKLNKRKILKQKDQVKNTPKFRPKSFYIRKDKKCMIRSKSNKILDKRIKTLNKMYQNIYNQRVSKHLHTRKSLGDVLETK